MLLITSPSPKPCASPIADKDMYWKKNFPYITLTKDQIRVIACVIAIAGFNLPFVSNKDRNSRTKTSKTTEKTLIISEYSHNHSKHLL